MMIVPINATDEEDPNRNSEDPGVSPTGIMSGEEADEAYATAQDSAVEYAFTNFAQNGMLAYEQLPDVLRCEGIEFSQLEIDNAVEAVFGGRTDELKTNGLMLPDVVDLYHYLVPSAGRQSALTEDPMFDRKRSVSYFAKCGECLRPVGRFFTQKKDAVKEFFTSMKPTNRLVLVIIIISFVMALAVAGTAIGLNWMVSMQEENKALKNELNLVLRAMEDFAVRQMREHAYEHAEDTALKLKGVIQEVGYHLNLHTTNVTQLNGANVIAFILDTLMDIQSKRWMQAIANHTTYLLNEMYTQCPGVDTAQLINGVNRNYLPEGHELMVVSRNLTQQPIVSSDLRYPVRCPNRTCNITKMASVLAASVTPNGTGGFFGSDYAGDSVYGGYSYLSKSGLGVIYKVNMSVLQRRYLNESVDVINIVNRDYAGSTEIMIQLAEKPGWPLSVYKLRDQCPHGCTYDHAGKESILSYLAGGSPTAIDLDYRETVPILATTAKLNWLDAFFLVEIDVPEVIGYVYQPLAQATETINENLTTTNEILVGHRLSDGNGGYAFEMLTTPKFKSQCPKGKCLEDQAMKLAAADCVDGRGVLTDYRGVQVLAGYMCIPELDIGIVLKFDDSEVFDSTVEHTLEYVNGQNQRESSSLELMMGLMIKDQNNITKPEVISDWKYPAACAGNPYSDSCLKRGTKFAPMIEALKGKEGDMVTTDYRGKKVMSFYNVGDTIGFVFKIDSDEIERPLLINVVIVIFTALGIVLLGDAILGFAAHRMLASIQATWDKSRQAVQEQKENFEQLLSALYPKFVKDRLVAGDTQIFLELQDASVFFSDICNFTMISNQLTAQELLQWIGYTFGIMDHVANYYAVYKIKTIGDAYLAVAGFPGLIPDGEHDYHCLRMTKFASACIQIFSGRYTHPDAGSCLDMIASRSAVLRKEQKTAAAAKTKKRSSIASSAMASVFSAGGPSGGGGGKRNKSMCNMRFGIASGALTVGVLQGKCPAFDVWGKTVNLACRMESTGRPNCIHVTESVYLALAKDRSSPFTFDKPHSTFAKGFGNVPAYFVRNTTENPPKVLLEELSLEPHLGDFGFDVGGGLGGGGGRGGGGGGQDIPAEGSMAGSITNGPLPPEASGAYELQSSRTSQNHVSPRQNFISPRQPPTQRSNQKDPAMDTSLEMLGIPTGPTRNQHSARIMHVSSYHDGTS